jgi:methyl-accepting chemotaxis protein
MANKKGIKSRIILNSIFSVMIFSLFLVWLTNVYWTVLLNDKKEKLQSIVEIASSIVAGFINLEKNGSLSKSEAQKKAKEVINNIRYSGKEYIFITNTKYQIVLVPVKPELTGKDMSNYRDPTGLRTYVEMANVVKKSGSGYLEYMFPKAGSSTPIQKISYLNYFPEWDWIVGTGLYMDDAYNALLKFLEILLFACIFCIITLLLLGIYLANSVVKPLSSVCQSLLVSSDSLLNKSDQLKDSSNRVKNYSNEQASSIQTTAAAIAEITSMIAKTTDLTGNSAILASTITSKAENGEISMKNMISSMQSIYEASSKLKEIEQIINEIETKTKVINKIVSKTELLSLNASIEAARAGEHGKGFSVVAEEVGNLAHVSGKSSDEIRKLLQKSREEVQQILTQTLEKVADGQKRTMKVSESFSEIVEGIKGINQQMSEISEATKEQEIGVRQISTAMTQLDQLALKNTQESENSLIATDKIYDESANLKKIIDKTEDVVYGFGKKSKESKN